MKIKFILIFLFFSANSYAQYLSLPCPKQMMKAKTITINTGSGSKRIKGPATIRFDECRVDFTEKEIIPYLKLRVDTNAKFYFKKKILFARVNKTIDLKCSFNSTVRARITEGCNLEETNFSFYRLKCRGFPGIFTKLIEKLIKKEIRKKGGGLIKNLFSKLMGKNDLLQDLCPVI